MNGRMAGSFSDRSSSSLHQFTCTGRAFIIRPLSVTFMSIVVGWFSPSVLAAMLKARLISNWAPLKFPVACRSLANMPMVLAVSAWSGPHAFSVIANARR